MASVSASAKHVSAYVRFVNDAGGPSDCSLAGPGSELRLHSYLESLRPRGPTVPGTALSALAVWAEALGIDWPVANPLVKASTVSRSDRTVRHAPAFRVQF